MTLGTVDVSYVLPAHNAAGVLVSSLDAVRSRFAADGRSVEVIVVENGSTDATWQIAQDRADESKPPVVVRAMRSPKGFGAAIRVGVAATRGDLVVATGVDLPFGFTDLDAAEGWEAMRPAVFVGSKRHPDSKIENRPRSRAVMTVAFAAVRSVMLASKVRDTQGSLVMPGRVARTLCSHTHEDGFLITTEIIELAYRAGGEVVEVPVTHHSTDEPSTVRPIADSVTMLRGLRRMASRARATGAAGTIDLNVDNSADGNRP